MLSVIMLSVILLSVFILNCIMLSLIMLSPIVLSVIICFIILSAFMLGVILPRVVASSKKESKNKKNQFHFLQKKLNFFLVLFLLGLALSCVHTCKIFGGKNARRHCKDKTRFLVRLGV